MTTDRFDDLAVRFAVTEQLVLELAAFLARLTEDPSGEAANLMDDLRDRFDPKSGDDAAMKAFKVLAQDHVGLLEQRIGVLLSP